MQLLFYGPKYFCTHWISFKNSLNHKSLITICSTTFRSRFQGLSWDLGVCFQKTVSCGTVRIILSFNTFMISHHFRYKFQKNTVRQLWMKQLAVLVEKSKLGDIPKFQNFLTTYDESSCRGHLGGVHSSSLIFFKLIRLIYLYMWLSNTFISCLFSILWFSRRFTRSLRIFRTLLFQPPSNLVCFGKQFSWAEGHFVAHVR